MAGDVEIKSAKHASSSVNPFGLYFVGKQKGAETTGMRNTSPSSDHETLIPVQDLKDIYWISDAEVQRINQLVKP